MLCSFSQYILYEPAHEKRELFFWFVLQMRMRSPYLYYRHAFSPWNVRKGSSTCLRTAKAQAKLRLCACSPEPLLVSYVISTIFSRLAPRPWCHVLSLLTISWIYVWHLVWPVSNSWSLTSRISPRLVAAIKEVRQAVSNRWPLVH